MTSIMDFGGTDLRVKSIGTGYDKPGASVASAGRTLIIPALNAKVGATSGWVITAGTNISHATLPASQTSSTLVIPITGLAVGDTLTAVSVHGQAESAGNIATLSMDVRKTTTAAAAITDASLDTDASGNITADTIISGSNVGVTGLSEVIAENEAVYVLLTGTTAASTDLDITHIAVTFTQAS